MQNFLLRYIRGQSVPVMSHKKSSFPTVPVQDLPASALNAAEEPYRPVILIVDDESMIADSLADILKRSGYAAFAAYDGEAALETALVMPPELLISDVILPGMNGIELAITIKRIFPDCKVILSSGQSSTSRLLATADASGHHFLFLNKPVHPRDLLAHVSESLKARKQPATVHPIANSAQSSGLD
jgi:DNA-binding response OmpR family regulator